MKHQMKPERYIVSLTHYNEGQREEVWVSYNTKLDKGMQASAYQQAMITANRYGGDVFMEYPNGDTVAVRERRKY